MPGLSISSSRLLNRPACYWARKRPLQDIGSKLDGWCNQLPDPTYCPVLLASALPSYVSDIIEMTYRLRSSGSTFIYLYHLISIDLQSSRSFNTHTVKLTVISPDRTSGSHYLLSNYLDRTTYCTSY